MQNYSPAVDCPATSVTMSQAMVDQEQPEAERQGLMYCYCLSQFLNVNFQVITLRFSDGNNYCATWLEKYTLSNAFIYLVAAGIAVVNIAVKTLLRCKTIKALIFL